MAVGIRPGRETTEERLRRLEESNSELLAEISRLRRLLEATAA